MTLRFPRQSVPGFCPRGRVLLFVSLFLITILESVPGHAGEASRESVAKPRFSSVEVWVDSGQKPLASYQVVIKASRGNPRIVGVEGGEGVYHDPPHYDPKAMEQDRVILGAYSLEPDSKLPQGRVRVATIHFQYHGIAVPEFSIRLQSAATSDALRIPATVFLVPPKQL